MNRAREMEAHAKARFAQDTAEHTMEIELDEGLYRRLKFRKPGTGMYWFDVITWPGTLCIRGDMGNYVFARLEDMFEFFRGHAINPQYWAEKVVAGQDNIKRFSHDVWVQHIKEAVEQYVEWEQPEKEDLDRLWVEVEDRLIRNTDTDHPDGARYAVGDFWVDLPSIGRRFEFHDTWEWDSTEYTIHFLWCCYAIMHAIEAYDAAKVPA